MRLSMGFRKDIWRVGVLSHPVELIWQAGEIPAGSVTWLPNPEPLAFYADPFGIWRGDRLYVFVEHYAYATRRGEIEVFTLDENLSILDSGPALAEPWHLSYPYVFEHEGETYLLPEAFQSGRLTLYRADSFPYRWSAVARLDLDAVPIDATPFHHDGRWWLFYAPDRPEAAKTRALHVAFADSLVGPWRAHPGNPVRYDVASSRPGGAVSMSGGVPILPVQDCTMTYGGGLRPLAISKLTTSDFTAKAGPPLRRPADWRSFDGMHTLSGAGAVTLVDVKRQIMTPDSLRLDFSRHVGGLAAKLTTPSKHEGPDLRRRLRRNRG